MALNAETDAILKELEASGFNMSSVRQQAQSNPVLENVANSKLGGGVLRRQEFVAYKEAKDKEVETLRGQVTSLAALKDSLGDFKDNKELYQAALDKIEILEENLVTAGFDPEEVSNLSLKEKTGLGAALNLAGKKDAETQVQERKEERTMPDDKNFIDVNTFQAGMANLAGGTLIGGIRAQRQLMRAQSLGIDVTDELAEKFEKNLLSGLEAGKSYDQIADETFGFSAKIAERNEAAVNERIESAKREAVATALKEAGVPASRVSTTRARSIMDNYASTRGVPADSEVSIEGSGGTKIINGRKVPVNKDGDVEFYKIRGTKSDRIQHAIAFDQKMQEEKPDLYEDVY